MAALPLRTAGPHVPWWAGRALLLVVAVLAAYWLSLASLLRGLGGQTPLAFVGLAPLLAVALLLAGLGRRDALPSPARVDAVVGLGLIAAAGAMVLFAPPLTSTYFWAARLDVASLPLFAAGGLILLFGWRVLFVARGALAVLLLAWPLPYLVLIENTAEWLTAVTAGALTVVTAVFPIAHPRPGGEAIFTVAYAPDPFPIQVATACAGLNSTVAFLLVGSAFVLLLRGSALAKLTWFATGIVLVFLLNVARVVLLVAVGAGFGPTAALELFHPVAGMAALAAGLGVMLLLLPRFGLAVPEIRPAPPVASPLPPRATTVSRRAHAGRAALLLTIAACFAAANATFAAYEAGPFDENGVAISPLAEERDALAGWNVGRPREILIGRPYFGADSSWVRYRLWPAEATSASDRYTVWLDDLVVTDQQRLADFGVEKCYRFHGHSIDAAEALNLGGGVVGRIMAITRARGSQWLVLWWEWPIEMDGRVHHERIVLLASTSADPEAVAIDPADGPGIDLQFGEAIPPELEPLAANLATLGSGIVADAAARTATP